MTKTSKDAWRDEAVRQSLLATDGSARRVHLRLRYAPVLAVPETLSQLVELVGDYDDECGTGEQKEILALVAPRSELRLFAAGQIDAVCFCDRQLLVTDECVELQQFLEDKQQPVKVRAES